MILYCMKNIIYILINTFMLLFIKSKIRELLHAVKQKENKLRVCIVFQQIIVFSIHKQIVLVLFLVSFFKIYIIYNDTKPSWAWLKQTI